MKKIYIFLFSFFALSSFAQVPVNDICTNAQAIVLTNGQACINSTNLNATSDNTNNAPGVCDIGTPGNEVWYTFVASDANNVITITPNGATPATDLVITLVTTGCGSGVYSQCNSATGSNSLSVTDGLAPGQQVLFSVESNGTDGTFQVCVSSMPPPNVPGEGCAQATNICTKSSIDFPSMAGFTASGTWPGCFGSPVKKDVWVKFTVGVSGTLEFLATPIGATAEFDWAVFNITSGCLGTEVACDYDFTGATTSFGLSSTVSADNQLDDIQPPITVTAGQTYAILIDNFTAGSNTGFGLDWGGTFQMGTAAIFTVTPNSSCTVPVNVTITNGSVGATTYTWNYGDGSATTNVANPPVHTYTVSGDYLVSLVANGGGCTSVYSQRVNLNSGPVITMNPLTATICPSATVNLGATIALGTPYNDRSYTNNPNAAIPNNNATGLSNTITTTGMLTNTITAGVVQSICFTINHTEHADIGDANANDVTIRVNGNTYNFTPLPLPSVSGTATYCFPQSVLNAIMAAGGVANTPWVLKVADTYNFPFGGTGSLISWNIVLRDKNSITGYTWSPTASLTNTNTLNPTASPTTTTIYSITATDLFGCTNTKTVTVVVGSPTTTASTTGTLTCSATTVALNSTLAGVNYTWTAPAGGSVGSANTQSTTASGAAGIYTLNISSGACTYSTTTSVTQNTTVPTVTVSATQTITCATPTVTLIGSATPSSCTPVWTGGVISGSNSYTATATASNVYTLTVTNPANGCVNSATMQVVSATGIPSVTTSVTNSLSCTSLTAQVVATTTSSPVSYSWTGPGITAGATTASATVNAGGQYTVVVTNTVSACSSTLTASVTQNTITPSVTGATSGTLTCTTLTVNASATTTTTPVSYNWTGTGITAGAATGTITVNQSGTFNYTVTNASNGCATTGSLAVTQNTTAPTLTVSTTQTITCAAPTVTLVGSATPSTCTPVWTGGVVSGTNSYTATASAPNVYTLTVTNPANGCVNSAMSQVVAAVGIPSVTTSVTNSLSCTSLTAQVVATTTSSPVSYNWTGPGVIAGATTASATVNAGGLYTVVVTNTASACSTTLTASVTQNTTAPLITGATSGTLTCTTLTVNASATTTTAPVSYNWTGTGITAGAATGTITVNQPGTFNYTVTNTSNGCTTTGSQAVAQNTIVPTLTVSATQTITCAAPTVTLIGSATPSTCTPVWAGGVASGAASYTATAIAANIYTLTVTNPTNGCVNSAVSQVVMSAGIPSVTTSVTNSLSCSTLTAQVIATTTTSPVSYNWAGTGIIAGAGTATITVNQASTYDYTVTNTSNGCIATGSQAVTQNTTAPTLTVSPTQTITCAAPTVTLIGSATPSTCTPVWTGGVVTGINSYTATASAPNVYTLTVTDPANGCINSATTQVVAAAGIPSVTTSVTNSLSCTSLTTQVVATTSSPVSYSWTGPGITAGATTASATVNAGGQYTVVVTNTVSACSSTLTASVIQNTITPSVTGATSGTLTCTTLTVDVSATTTTTPVSYNWTGTGITAGAGTGTITVNLGGTFNYTVTDGNNGCATTGSQAVTQNTIVPTLTVSATQTITCASPTVTLIGSASPSTCTPVWTGGVASGINSYTATATAANIYTLTVTDPANGCVNSATTQVVMAAGIPVVAASVTNSLSCTTLTAQAIANTTTTPVSYNWTGTGITAGAGTGTITVNQSGTFDYTVTNTSNGCITTGSLAVIQNTTSPSVVGAVSGTLTCTTSTVDVSATTTTTPVSYNWIGTGITAGIGTGTITVNQPGAFDYTVTNTSNGCTTVGSQAVTQNTAAPTITVSASNPTICPMGSSTLTVGGATSYAWSPGLTLSSSTGSVTIASPPVTETYTVIGTIGTCTNSAQVVVTVTTTPVITVASSPTICSGTSATLTAGGASTYTWTNASTLSSPNGSVVIATPPSTQNYTVTGASTFGCTNFTTVIVTVIATPTLMASSSPTVICNGDNTTLTASGATAYTWSPAASVSNSNAASTSANPSNTTIYTVVGSNGTGPVCASSKTVEVVVIRVTQPITFPAAPMCFGSSNGSFISATGGTSYSWSPTTNVTNPNDSMSTVYPITTTVYTVTASQNGMCPGTATVQVIVHPLPLIDAGRDTTVNIDEAYILHGSGNVEVGFVPTNGTPLDCNFCPNLMVNPQENTCYLLKGESAFGCISYDEVCITVTKDYNVYIPNSFTPNDDLINEVFQPVGYGILEFKMSVYDRWGGLIFNSNDTQLGWDGKNKGLVCEEGVYVYIVEYKTMGGQKGKKAGHITVIPRVK